MEEEIIDLLGIAILLILTCLNVALCQSDKIGIWFIHVLFLMYIPTYIITIFDSISLDFSEVLLYFLFALNVYMNSMKLRYLYGKKNEEN